MNELTIHSFYVYMLDCRLISVSNVEFEIALHWNCPLPGSLKAWHVPITAGTVAIANSTRIWLACRCCGQGAPNLWTWGCSKANWGRRTGRCWWTSNKYVRGACRSMTCCRCKNWTRFRLWARVIGTRRGISTGRWTGCSGGTWTGRLTNCCLSKEKSKWEYN